MEFSFDASKYRSVSENEGESRGETVSYFLKSGISMGSTAIGGEEHEKQKSTSCYNVLILREVARVYSSRTRLYQSHLPNFQIFGRFASHSLTCETEVTLRVGSFSP